MKVLVTGAAGTVGGEVSALLHANGHAVRAHDRAPFDPASADEQVAGDLLDPAHVREIVAGVSAVVHVAAIPAPMLGTEQEIFSNNVMSAYQVLDAAGRAGVPRIVYVSSISALGFAYAAHPISPERIPVTEQHPFRAQDVYGLSKHLGERIARTVAERWGSTVVSLRFPFLGHGERLRRHLDYVRADPGADRGGLWAWLDTRDAARAVEAALTRPLTGHHLVHAVAPDTSSSIPTAELLRRFHPRSVLTQPVEGFDSPISGALARELLGFTPVYSWRTAEGDER